MPAPDAKLPPLLEVSFVCSILFVELDKGDIMGFGLVIAVGIVFVGGLVYAVAVFNGAEVSGD